MSYKLTLTQEPTYLHAIVTGSNTKESVMGYLAEILRESVRRNCRRILVEERLEGPSLGRVAVYQIVSTGSLLARGIFEAIAYVDVNARGDLMWFAEALAAERGLPMRVFSSTAEAEKWLLAQAH